MRKKPTKCSSMASHLDGIIEFVVGQDVFVSLPTGFGKSFCYILLPRIFDLLRGVENTCVLIVVSPLIALMKNQVASITKIGLSDTYASDRDTKLASTSEQSVKKGNFSIVFISPEALFISTNRRVCCYQIHIEKN